MIMIFPSGNCIRTGVAKSKTTIVVIEERQQFGRRVEPHQTVMLLAARLEIFDLTGEVVDYILLVDPAAVPILRVENEAVLPLAPKNSLHEFQDHVALTNIILRLDCFESEQAASTHAETDGADAPVMDAIDLGTDLATRRGADVHDALRADLVGCHLAGFPASDRNSCMNARISYSCRGIMPETPSVARMTSTSQIFQAR